MRIEELVGDSVVFLSRKLKCSDVVREMREFEWKKERGVITPGYTSSFLVDLFWWGILKYIVRSSYFTSLIDFCFPALDMHDATIKIKTRSRSCRGLTSRTYRHGKPIQVSYWLQSELTVPRHPPVPPSRAQKRPSGFFPLPSWQDTSHLNFLAESSGLPCHCYFNPRDHG